MEEQLLKLIENNKYPAVTIIAVMALGLYKFGPTLYHKWLKFFNLKVIDKINANDNEHTQINNSITLMKDDQMLFFNKLEESNQLMGELRTSMNDTRDILFEKMSELNKDLKKLNYRFTVSIDNGTNMETKLIEAITSIDYKNHPVNIQFKSSLIELGELISKLYTHLRLQGLNIIDLDNQSKALDSLRLIFQKNGITDESKLKYIVDLADVTINKFNTIKQDGNNSDLITQLYIKFIMEIYEELTR